MTFRDHQETQYHGWKIIMDWNLNHPGEDKWDHEATQGERRIVQGTRTILQFYEALDRLDGRPTLIDLLKGLGAGLSREEASKPIPFDSEGNPLYPWLVKVASHALPPAPPPAPILPKSALAQRASGQPVQQSLFGKGL